MNLALVPAQWGAVSPTWHPGRSSKGDASVATSRPSTDWMNVRTAPGAYGNGTCTSNVAAWPDGTAAAPA